MEREDVRWLQRHVWKYCPSLVFLRRAVEVWLCVVGVGLAVWVSLGSGPLSVKVVISGGVLATVAVLIVCLRKWWYIMLIVPGVTKNGAVTVYELSSDSVVIRHNGNDWEIPTVSVFRVNLEGERAYVLLSGTGVVIPYRNLSVELRAELEEALTALCGSRVHECDGGI